MKKHWIYSIVSLPSIILLHALLFLILIFVVAYILSLNAVNQFSSAQYFVASLAAVLGLVVLIVTSLRNLHLIHQETEKNQIIKDRLEHDKQRHQWEKEIRNNTIERLTNDKTEDERTRLKISEDIAYYLTEHPKWALKAMQYAPLYPYRDTTFAKRTTHYEKEKELIGKQFAKLLIERLNYLTSVQGKTRIYLLIDSGTTVIPFMEELSRRFSQMHDITTLQNHVRIITNNIAGTESYLFPEGKEREHVPIHLAPGRPVARSRAVTTPKEASQKAYTEKYVSDLIHATISETGKDEVHIISVVTGNWVGLRAHQPGKRIIPRAFARGTGHIEFKEMLCREADELYVISPLGKLVLQKADENVSTFNQELMKYLSQEDIGAAEDSGERYKEVSSEILDRHQNVLLITTSRPNQNSILSTFTGMIKSSLNLSEFSQEDSSEIINHSSEVGGFMFPLDIQARSNAEQMNIEFPHIYTHNEKFLGRFQIKK